MREEVSNWFARWEEELPPPEDLMPLSQTLITRDLAVAFDIWNSDHHHNHTHTHTHTHQPPLSLPPPPPFQAAHNTTTTTNPSSQPNSSAEFDSSELGGTVGGSGGEESARTLKRPRLVWTPQLHKRFVDAVAQLGIKNAVPKTIMQLMSVDGLTRENVASHLQKYRLYLKRMQGNSYGGGSNNNSGLGSGVGSDMDHLFASSPVPVQFLHQGRPNSDHFVPFSPVTPMQHSHHQMAAAAVIGHHHHHNNHHHHHHQSQLQQQFRHFGTSPPNGHFEHPYLGRQSLAQVQRMGASGLEHSPMMPSYIEDMESVAAAAAAANGRKVLTLFPTRDD